MVTGQPPDGAVDQRGAQRALVTYALQLASGDLGVAMEFLSLALQAAARDFLSENERPAGARAELSAAPAGFHGGSA